MTCTEKTQCAGEVKEVLLKHETVLRTQDEWRVFAVAEPEVSYTHTHTQTHTHTHAHTRTHGSHLLEGTQPGAGPWPVQLPLPCNGRSKYRVRLRLLSTIRRRKYQSRSPFRS